MSSNFTRNSGARPSRPRSAVVHGGRDSQHSQVAPRPAAARAIDLDVSTSEVDASKTFAELGVPAAMIHELGRLGAAHPFPIQSATLPDSLAGRDLLGRGKTGSGKTIAFAIPVVASLAASAANGNRRQPGKPRALILVPTRELANQVAEAVRPLASAMSLKLCTVYGGVGQGPQAAAIRSGVDIVVACPGRLEDLIQQRLCRLDAVEVTVLDEADHMADLGFLPGVKRLLDATPQSGQRLLFSATLDNGIDVLVQRYLHNPVVHSVDPEVAPVSTMVHHVFAVSQADKPTVVKELASGAERSLLFMRTKHGAKKLAKVLTTAGIPAVELHGNLSQAARQRNLDMFSAGTTRVLVATDIAARGIHVDDIALVVHVDPPAEHKAYLHRSGRTARAGAEGVVVTVMTPDQAKDVRGLARAAGIAPIISTVVPGDSAITELVGAPAAYVRPVADSRPSQVGVRQPRSNDGPRSQRPAGRSQHSTDSRPRSDAGRTDARPQRNDAGRADGRPQYGDAGRSQGPAQGPARSGQPRRSEGRSAGRPEAVRLDGSPARPRTGGLTGRPGGRPSGGQQRRQRTGR